MTRHTSPGQIRSDRYTTWTALTPDVGAVAADLYEALAGHYTDLVAAPFTASSPPQTFFEHPELLSQTEIYTAVYAPGWGGVQPTGSKNFPKVDLLTALRPPVDDDFAPAPTREPVPSETFIELVLEIADAPYDAVDLSLELEDYGENSEGIGEREQG